MNIFPPNKKRSDQLAKKMSKAQLDRLKKAFDHKDYISQRQAAKKFNISQSFFLKIVEKASTNSFIQLNFFLRHVFSIPACPTVNDICNLGDLGRRV